MGPDESRQMIRENVYIPTISPSSLKDKVVSKEFKRRGLRPLPWLVKRLGFWKQGDCSMALT